MIDVMPKPELDQTRDDISDIENLNARTGWIDVGGDVPFYNLHAMSSCRCHGENVLYHSPFFIPGQHHPRVLPRPLRNWKKDGKSVFLAPPPNTGFAGFGMGGAGDNAGGYLGGAYTPTPPTTAILEALRAIKPSRQHLLKKLPGGSSAVVSFLKNKNREPMVDVGALLKYESSAMPFDMDDPPLSDEHGCCTTKPDSCGAA